MTIPIEDSYTDIIGKAQRGLGISDSVLAEKAGLSADQIRALKDGAVTADDLRQAATVLDLGPDSLLALAEGRYQPAPVAELEGLGSANTAFEDMTVNAFLVWDPASREAAIFDTGADGQPLMELAQAKGLKITQIFLTHTHGDHILDLDRLKEKTGASAYVCEKEALEGAESFSPGRTFSIGALSVETRLTSGHAAGGITYVIAGLAKPVAVVGDAIFAGSMGGGMVSYADALRNNREQILTLSDDTILCPGHGPLTTVGEQKAANPFFAA